MYLKLKLDSSNIQCRVVHSVYNGLIAQSRLRSAGTSDSAQPDQFSLDTSQGYKADREDSDQTAVICRLN